MFLFLKGPHPIFLIFFFNKNNPHPYTKNTGEEKRIFYEFVCCLILRIMLVSQSVPILLPPPPPPQLCDYTDGDTDGIVLVTWCEWWWWGGGWAASCVDQSLALLFSAAKLYWPITGFVVFCCQNVSPSWWWLRCLLLSTCFWPICKFGYVLFQWCVILL